MKPALPLVLSALLLPGCIFAPSGSSSSGGADDPTREPVDESEPLLEECREDHDIPDATQIVGDFDLSIHEMVACGGLSVRLCASIVSGIVNALADNRPDATPNGWVYEGDGLYTSNAAAAGMTTQFYLATDTSFGAAGDKLTENLFLASTYLQGASVDVDVDPNDPLSLSATLHFDAPGPYAELLGFGPDPQSPIPVDLSTWSQIEERLGQLEFEATVAVDDPRDETTVRYEVETARMSAAALLGAAPMSYELVRADATRGDLEQDLVVDTWGVDFVNGSVGALQGTIEFHVEGGPLEYRGAFEYDNATYADIELECL